MLNNKIVIIDYKMGNLRSVQKSFEKIGASVVITNNHSIIKSADKLVLPGVGSFKDGINNLKKLGLIDILEQEVINNKKPFLGICLGMHLIANKSSENGSTRGFSWIDANIIKFDLLKIDKKLKVPHVGWNNILFKNKNNIFEGIDDNSDFYFVHSYYLETNEEIITSTTNHGIDFASSIQKDNIYACQFHPEKSQLMGQKVIQNFSNLEYGSQC